MTALMLLATVVAVTWLCVWVMEETPTPPGKWCPFEISDADDEQAPTPDPRAGRGWRSGPGLVRDRSERPWKRSGS